MQSRILKIGVGFFFIVCIVMFMALLYLVYNLDIEPVSEHEIADGKNSKTDSLDSGSGELGTVSPLSEGSESSEQANSAGGSSGGGGGGGSISSAPNEPVEIELPKDLYTAPCGVYFTSYGVCNGSCTEGICTQEGRSCYCKLT